MFSIGFFICLFQAIAGGISKKEIDQKLGEFTSDSAKVYFLRDMLPDIEEATLGKQVMQEGRALVNKSRDPKLQIKWLKSEALFYYNQGEEETCRKTLQKAFKLAQTNTLHSLQMEVLFLEINLFFEGGSLEDAVPKTKYLFPILSKVESKGEQGEFLSQIGRKFYSLGNYPEAMKYYVQAQDIFEKNNIRNEDYGHLLHNIGSVFKRQDNLEKALEYYETELALGREINSESIIAEGLYLSAGMYAELGDTKKGREYNEKSLAIYEKMGKKNMIALLTGNMAGDYADEGNYKKAIQSLEKALKIFTEEKEWDKIAWIQRSLAEYHSQDGNHSIALDYIGKASANALKTTNKQLLRKKEIARTLAYIYYRKKDYKQAFDTYMDYRQLEDSLTNNDKLKVVGELESKYENEKKEAEIAMLNKDKKLKAVELEKAAAEVKEQKLMRNGMVLVIGLVLIVCVVIYRGYRINKKNNYLLSRQNDEINLKNLIIEEKNKNITDSIAYAKRIQEAILPPKSLLNEYLKNGFIYYEPKDIVAGDFYWMEHVGDEVLFAAADCTGHGVPGAMISVVCHNALNRAVREFGLTDPSIVLDKVRELVIETFEKSQENVQDGMDIALCTLDRKNKELKFSGANNSLYIVRGEELIELKADKQPISSYVESKPFTLHNFKLQKGDTIYSFTDGFADQFGGEKGKKFKYKPFKELLLSIQSETMEEQYRIIKETFHAWRGDLEQIDDVCVLGVRV
ncbi:MAG: tetratricopeptide repeat protein [Flavobacteriales bacterium]|nr:tetratricopeptide repeat protein [Flavobacteriales bacterium]